MLIEQKCTFIMNIVKIIVGFFITLLLVQCDENKKVTTKIDTTVTEKLVEAEFGKNIDIGGIIAESYLNGKLDEKIFIASISDSDIVINSRYGEPNYGAYKSHHCIPYTIPVGSTSVIYSEYYKGIKIQVVSTNTEKGTVNLKVTFGEEKE